MGNSQNLSDNLTISDEWLHHKSHWGVAYILIYKILNYFLKRFHIKTCKIDMEYQNLLNFVLLSVLTKNRGNHTWNIINLGRIIRMILCLYQLLEKEFLEVTM